MECGSLKGWIKTHKMSKKDNLNMPNYCHTHSNNVHAHNGLYNKINIDQLLNNGENGKKIKLKKLKRFHNGMLVLFRLQDRVDN